MSGELHQESELLADIFIWLRLRICCECAGGRDCKDKDCIKRFMEQAEKMKNKIEAGALCGK